MDAAEGVVQLGVGVVVKGVEVGADGAGEEDGVLGGFSFGSRNMGGLRVRYLLAG